MTCLIDGIIIDDKTKIIAGEININLPKSFVLNAEFNINYHVYKLMYNSNLYCEYDSSNSDTYLYPGSINISNYFTTLDYVKIYGISSYNMLVVKAKSSDDVQNIIYLLNVNEKYVKFSFLYDYICYYAANDLSSKCPGNRFEASDTTSLLMAIKDNPNTPISVGQDLTIPYQSQNHFILNIKEDNIKINLPLTPLSMLIQDEDHIQVNYNYDTLIDIYNESILYIPLMDTFEFNSESKTNSIIYFKLNSDVIFSTKSNLSANFNISVINNDGYKMYAEDVDKFKNIFDFPLIPYVRVYAYDINASSLCTYKKKDLIENVFNTAFNYNEVEIALLSNRNIELPNISSFINVNIISNSSSVLNVKNVTDLELTYDTVIINNYWKFIGDKEVLNINLNKSLSLSISEYILTPISFQLLEGQTEINLKRCIYPYEPIITIHHNGSYQNKITVYGSSENYYNFIRLITNHDGITFNHDGVQKYLCLCNDDDSCSKCEENIDGYFEKASKITSDPGDNVEIRVFSNIEISSSLFQSENNVYIDPDCHLNLTDAETVDQNFYQGLKVDNLYFTNVNNLLIKPKSTQLNINMRIINYGLHFQIERDSFLRLNVINSYDSRINASRLYVSGSGELNLYDYPYNRIRANSTVKVIKGVYTICNARAGNNICTYVTDEGYKTLNNYDGFSNDFDPDSKIIVFVNSFSNNLDADINYLKGQKVSFIRQKVSLNNKLDDEKQVKVRFYPTTELTSNSDLTTELSNSHNGALLDITDSDLFIVGFNESLTIKQNGDISLTKSNPIVLQPMNEKVTIIVDDSVDIGNQQMRIESENDKPVSVTIKTNKKNSDELNNLFQTDPRKVSIIVEQNSSSPKKLPKAAIIGIVVGAIVIIAILVVLIIVLVKKKAKSVELSDSESTEESGSIRI